MIDIRDPPFPITVTEVHAFGDYRLALCFQNENGDLWYETLSRQRHLQRPGNPGKFSLVSIENGATSWPNGADIAPERLHTDCDAE